MSEKTECGTCVRGPEGKGKKLRGRLRPFSLFFLFSHSVQGRVRQWQEEHTKALALASVGVCWVEGVRGRVPPPVAAGRSPPPQATQGREGPGGRGRKGRKETRQGTSQERGAGGPKGVSVRAAGMGWARELLLGPGSPARSGERGGRRSATAAPRRATTARALSLVSLLPLSLHFYFIFHRNVARPTPALLPHKPHPTHTMSTEHVVPAVGFVTDMTSELIGEGANGGAHERQQRQAARMGGRRKRGGPPRATHAAGCQPPGPSTCQGRALHAWLTPRLLGTRRHAPSRAGGGGFFPCSLPVRGSAGRCPAQHPRVPPAFPPAHLPSSAPARTRGDQAARSHR